MASESSEGNVKIAVLMGYVVGIVTAVPPVSLMWEPLSRIPEYLYMWAWSALSSASEFLPEIDDTVDTQGIEMVHVILLVTVAVAAMAPGAVSLMMRIVVDESAYLHSLGQAVAWIIIPASGISLLFLPLRMSILVILTALAVSAVIIVEPAQKAAKFMWLVQGVMSVQTIAWLLRGPSGSMQAKALNYINTTGTGTIQYGEYAFSLKTQIWFFTALVAGSMCLHVIRLAWNKMKPPPRSSSSTRPGW